MKVTNVLEVFKDIFGQRHLVVRVMLDDATSAGFVSPDAEILTTFANKLTNCSDVLEQLGYVADLNSVSTIEKVLGKLPRYMTVDWVKRSDEIYQSDCEPTFRDLSDFVSSKARLQRNRYSYLLNNPRSVGGAAPHNTDRKQVHVVSTGGVCVNCNKDHNLEDCIG